MTEGPALRHFPGETPVTCASHEAHVTCSPHLKMRSRAALTYIKHPHMVTGVQTRL